MKHNQSKTYRIVNSKRFVLFLFAVAMFVAAGIYFATVGGNNVYAMVASQEEEAPTQPLIFQSGEKVIVAADQDEFIRLLKDSLEETTAQVDDLSEKYEEAVAQKEDAESKYEKIESRYNEILAEVTLEKKKQAYDLSLEKEYSYAINYPGSDVTVQDVKMVINLTRKYDSVVDPHLWFSLIELESGYNSKSRSKSSSAAGWGQVLKGTGKWVYQDLLKKGTYNHSTMGTNKKINAEISIYYLSELIKDYGVKKALINYNGGELGVKYANIVSTKLEKNSNRTLKQAQAVATASLN